MRNDLEMKLSINELNIIIAALGKRPYEEVFQLIDKIQQQVQEQLQVQHNGQLNENEQLINFE